MMYQAQQQQVNPNPVGSSLHRQQVALAEGFEDAKETMESKSYT